VAGLAEGHVGGPLTLLHRLDKDTSGVLLLGRTREFSAALLEDFRHRRVEKRYLALVRGAPRQTFEVVSHLREADGDRIQTVRSGGMRAETGFRVLGRAGDYALVEAIPRTGRTHQIRVHLSQVGDPILGDGLYGGEAAAAGRPVPRQMLHAWFLSFRHPASGESLRIEAPIPEDFREVARAIFGARLPGPLAGPPPRS
jgi:23S rRNA pseudouridine1911/1915/1917 synthase